MNEKFRDAYEGMTDDEIEKEALRIFNEPETTVSLTIPVEFREHIKALAERRAGEPVHQLMVRALNLGVRQIDLRPVAGPPSPRGGWGDSSLGTNFRRGPLVWPHAAAVKGLGPDLSLRR